jgi:hypothetical protein
VTDAARKSILIAASISLWCAFCATDLLAVYLTGPYAWDDGAITLAYARTLAEHGSFALTKVSEIVEGSSSLLLVFLIAGLDRLFHFDFLSIIRASQLLALSFLALTLWLVFNGLRKYLPSRSERLLLTCVFGSLPMFTAEVLNGMEMTLAALLLAAFYLSFSNRSRAIFVLIPLLLLVRYEMIFYLGFSWAAVWLLQPAERRRVTRLALYTLAVFSFFSVFRWCYFHDLLPNTIWAKLNPPYTPPRLSTRIHSRMAAGLEFLQVAACLLLPLMISFALLQKRLTRQYFGMGAAIVAAFAAFSIIGGPNFGYPGRMFLASLPIMVLALERRSAPGQRLTFNVLLVCLLVGHALNEKQWFRNLTVVATGAHFQQLLPKSVDARAERYLSHVEQLAPDMLGISPANYRITGLAVDQIRQALGMEKVDLMTPDIGGLGLCCEAINVIDQGLLTNATLARQGYGVLNDYLARVRPDVINTHSIWSQVSGIYSSDFFSRSYQPVVFDNNLFWVRSDLVARMLDSMSLAAGAIDDRRGLRGVRYAQSDIDRNYLDQRGTKSIVSFHSAGAVVQSGDHPH